MAPVKRFQDFPKDVQYNILKRLPLKSLIRFMCTSKSIHSIITNPSFLDLSHTIATGYHIYSRCTFYNEQTFFLNKHPIFIPSEENPTTYKKLTDVPVDGSYYPIGYCHGLVCFANILCRENLTLVIWNPFLGKSFTIPFDHFNVNVQSSVGFGYDKSHLDFKVVRIRILPHDDNTGVWAEIYALHSSTWKIVQGSLSHYVSKIKEQGVFVNDVIHWLLEIHPIRNKYVILTYDLAKEVFGEINVPKHGAYENIVLTKLVINGEEKLAIYHNSRLCKLWVMEEYGANDSWKEIFSFDCGDAYGKVLTCLANGIIMVSTNDGSLVSYDLENKYFELVKVSGMLEYVGPYVQSCSSWATKSVHGGVRCSIIYGCTYSMDE